MTSQRHKLRTFLNERARGVTAITLLTVAITVVGYILSIAIVWVLR